MQCIEEVKQFYNKICVSGTPMKAKLETSKVSYFDEHFFFRNINWILSKLRLQT